MITNEHTTAYRAELGLCLLSALPMALPPCNRRERRVASLLVVVIIIIIIIQLSFQRINTVVIIHIETAESMSPVRRPLPPY